MFIFNYTNVDNFKDGIDDKLNVQEVGPYIYSETVEKVNIVFNDDNTLTFQENRTYQFLPEISAGSEDDLIITPSIPLISADNELRRYNFNYFARFMVSATLRKIDPFRDLRVQDFLWGYDDPVYETARALVAFLNPLPYEKFGILVARNGLSKDLVTMYTGVDDMSKLGIISRFNGIQEMNHWGTAECNRIDGTDGTLYPVNQVSPNNTLHVFNHDLCRRFPLIFEKNVKTNEGIPALRFHAPRNVFDNPSTNPDNMCYCNEPSIPCLPAGVFNVSPCAFGAPIMLSFPHFFLGDPVLMDVVNGLQPDPSKHDMYVDMHEGLDELPDQIQDILYHFRPPVQFVQSSVHGTLAFEQDHCVQHSEQLHSTNSLQASLIEDREEQTSTHSHAALVHPHPSSPGMLFITEQARPQTCPA
uniref:Scavenger receptor class B member 1 n=1 Tax=Timema tahoe TaxID=61484 RepID=A0A7R9NZW6_9NEOP|nr:unnamed protein product [Timema tahoe]